MLKAGGLGPFFFFFLPLAELEVCCSSDPSVNKQPVTAETCIKVTWLHTGSVITTRCKLKPDLFVLLTLVSCQVFGEQVANPDTQCWKRSQVSGRAEPAASYRRADCWRGSLCLWPSPSVRHVLGMKTHPGDILLTPLEPFVFSMFGFIHLDWRNEGMIYNQPANDRNCFIHWHWRRLFAC